MLDIIDSHDTSLVKFYKSMILQKNNDMLNNTK